MVDIDKIERLMKKHFDTDGDFTINSTTGLVAVGGDVKLKEKIKVRRLPVTFDRVEGNFLCDRNQLVTLAGSPQHVGGGFGCSYNRLKSLVGGPHTVNGVFTCSTNNLVNLEGAPTDVGRDFDCSGNPLSSLDGSPRNVSGNFFCNYGEKLPLLRLLAYQNIWMSGRPLQLDQILKKYAGTGRRGAIQAAREIMQAGEQLQQLKDLDHNPFEDNARW
jgi:hypothetical protein